MAQEVYKAGNESKTSSNTKNVVRTVNTQRKDPVEKIKIKRNGDVSNYQINGKNVRVSAERSVSPYPATIRVAVEGERMKTFNFGWDTRKGQGDKAKFTSYEDAFEKAKTYIRSKTK